MGFIRNIGKALGLSSDDDSIYTPYGEKQQPTYVNPFKKEDEPEKIEFVPEPEPEPDTQKPVAQPSGALASSEMPTQVLDGMLEIINSNLPDIVKQSINEDAERKALVEAMGPQFTNYLNAVREAAINMAQTEWIAERSRLSDELKAAKDREGDALNRLNELKQRLNADNAQHRAAIDRVNELEGKVSALEAEHEQLDIENKSLVNKVKVMQVKYEQDANDAAALPAVKQELEKALATAAAISAERDRAVSEIESLTNEFKDKLAFHNNMLSEMQSAVAERNKRISELEADLQNGSDASAANALSIEKKDAEIALRDTLIAEQTEKLSQKDQQIVDLNTTIGTKEQEKAALQKQLDEANENLRIAAEIEQKSTEFEGFKEKKLTEIADLKQQITNLEQNNAANLDAIARLKDADAQRISLEQKISDLENSRSTDSSAFAKKEKDYKDAITNLREQLRFAGDKITANEGMIERLSADNSNNAAATMKLRDQKHDLEKKVKDLKASLETERATAQEAYQAAERQLTQATGQIASMQSLIEARDAEIAQLQQRLNAPKPIEFAQEPPTPLAAEPPVQTVVPEPVEVPVSLPDDDLDSVFGEPVGSIDDLNTPKVVVDELPEVEPRTPLPQADPLDGMDDIEWLMPDAEQPASEPTPEPTPEPQPTNPEPPKAEEKPNDQLSLF